MGCLLISSTARPHPLWATQRLRVCRWQATGLLSECARRRKRNRCNGICNPHVVRLLPGSIGRVPGFTGSFGSGESLHAQVGFRTSGFYAPLLYVNLFLICLPLLVLSADSLRHWPSDSLRRTRSRGKQCRAGVKAVPHCHETTSPWGSHVKCASSQQSDVNKILKKKKLGRLFSFEEHHPFN